MERTLSAPLWRKLSWSCLAVSLFSFTGCTGLLTMAAYLIKGTDMPAEFKDLKDKKVAVVCRAPVTMNTDQAMGCRELADRVTFLLQANVPKIKTIDQQDVADWTDENNWEDFREIGKALQAEMVVGIDIDDFSLQRSSSVYQGRAKVRISVYDMEKKERVYDNQPNQFLYPNSGGMPVSNVPRNEFRKHFVYQLADLIGTKFYAHDARSTFAADTHAMSLDQ